MLQQKSGGVKKARVQPVHESRRGTPGGIGARFVTSRATIGDHEAWIAALALEHGQSVATGDDRLFKRVPALAVRSY